MAAVQLIWACAATGYDFRVSFEFVSTDSSRGGKAELAVGLLSVFPKFERLAGFREIFAFIGEILKTRQICLRCSVVIKSVAKHQTRLRIFQLKTSFHQDESETSCSEEIFA